jgi:hypothetical protein
MQLRWSMKSRNERVRPKVGKAFVYLRCMTRWDENEKMSINPGVSQIYTPHSSATSVTPVPPYTHRRSIPMSMEAMIESGWRCIWRPWLCELRVTLRCREQLSLEMHLEADKEWTQRWTWQRSSFEFDDSLGGHVRPSLDMHLEAGIEWAQRCTPTLWSSDFGDPFGGRDRVNSEMNMDAAINRVWRWTGRSWFSKFGDAMGTDIEWILRWTLRLWSSEFRDAFGGRDRVNSELHLQAVIA